MSDITFNGQSLRAELAGDFFRNAFNLLASACGDYDRRALARERNGDGAANAAAPAGDESKSILKLHNVGAGFIPARSFLPRKQCGQGRALPLTTLSSREFRRPLFQKRAHAFATIFGFKATHLRFDFILQHFLQRVVLARIHRVFRRGY